VKPILPDKTMSISKAEIKGDMFRINFTEAKIIEKGFVQNSRDVASNVSVNLT